MYQISQCGLNYILKCEKLLACCICVSMFSGCSWMKHVDIIVWCFVCVLWQWTFFCPSVSLVCSFFLVTDSALSAGRFETQMAGALVQSSLEEVIKRFIHFSPNPSSDSISIPAAINPNASSSTAVHPKCIQQRSNADIKSAK